jgi:hypothetical protein
MINDSAFIGKPIDTERCQTNFTGIADKDGWTLDKVAEVIGTRRPPATDDPFAAGTKVEFTAPDGTKYTGKVASKSGDDYIIDINPGDSYLVPLAKLAKVSLTDEQIRAAARDFMAPDLSKLAESEESGRLFVRVAYKERLPSDGQLMSWASTHYPDIRLVDAVPKGNRSIDLVFELPKQAAEDVMPQGSAPKRPGERGAPLSSEGVDGTGVIGDKIPGGLSEGKNEEDFDPEALQAGIKVEMEHTEDPDMAKEIAMDHLTEDPKYYSKLKKMEGGDSEVLDTESGNRIDDIVMKLEDVVEDLKSHQDVIGMEEATEPTEFSVDDVVEKEAQLGQPGAAQQYEDLNKAARWVLARFNDSNPNFYATPQENEAAGDGDHRVVRLYFTLSAKTEDDKLNNLYISRQGSITSDPTDKPARGFVQVDSEGNLPMLMISGPTGPESIQEYGFSLSAVLKISSDVCAAVASEVLAAHGGYCAEAQADFEARLTKLAVDPTAKDYWKGYLKDYGKQLTKSVPRKKHQAIKKTAEVDQMAIDYWVNYFSSGKFDSGWYGKQMVRNVPRKIRDGVQMVDSDEEMDATDGKHSYYKNAQTQKAPATPAGIKPPQAPGVKLEKAPTKVTSPGATRPKTKKNVIRQLYEQTQLPGQMEQLTDAKSVITYAFTLAQQDPKVKELLDAKAYQFAAAYPNIRYKAVNDLKAQNPQKYSNPNAAWDDTVKFYVLMYSAQHDPKALEEIREAVVPKAVEWKGQNPLKVAYVKKEDGKYCVKSEDNPKWSGGCYESKEKAKERLQQVEYFKQNASKECPEASPVDILDMVSYSLVMSDNPDGVYRRFALLVNNNKKRLAVRNIVAATLQEVVRDSVKKSKDNLELRNELDRIMFGYLSRNPKVKYQVLEKLGQDTIDEKAATQILYIASQDKKYFNQLKKALDRAEKQEGKAKWKGLSEERAKLKPGLIDKGKQLLQKVFPGQQAPQAPVKPAPAPSTGPDTSEGPTEWGEPEPEPEVEVSAEPPAPAKPQSPPTLTKPQPPPPPAEEISESKVQPKSIVRGVPVPKEQQAKPFPVTKKTKEEYKHLGPSEVRPSKPVSEPAKSTPVEELTPEKSKELKNLAKEFIKEESPMAKQMTDVLQSIPYPKPTTLEQTRQYRERGMPRYMDMTIQEIADNDPLYAMQFLLPHLNNISDTLGHILFTYLVGKEEMKDYLKGKLPKKPRETKKEEGPRVVWKEDRNLPQVGEEQGFKETPVDNWKFPTDSPFAGMTIPKLMELMWKQKKQLGKTLDYIASNPEFNKTFLEWAKTALTGADYQAIVTAMENRGTSVRQTKSKEERSTGKPVETEGETLSTIKNWQIPDNEEVPAFVGMTIGEALKKNKPATIKYMRKNQPDKWLAFVREKSPDEYQYELNKVDEIQTALEKGGEEGLQKLETEKQEKKEKSILNWKIPKSNYSDGDSTITSVLSQLKDNKSGQTEFLKWVFEEYPDKYTEYVKSIDPAKADAYNKAIIALLEEEKGSVEPEVVEEKPEAVSEPEPKEEQIDIETLQKFYDTLSGFDWFYSYSDDARVWNSGKAMENKIKAMADTHPALKKLYDEYSRYTHDMTRSTPKPERPGSKEESKMLKTSKAGPGPHAYNAPGKDDKKDYDYSERNRQQPRNRNKFKVTRMYSTSSSDDAGYIIMEVAWEPEMFADMSPQNIQHQVISFVKGLESMRQFHDFGFMGRPALTEFDADAGVARLKVRCSQTKGVFTLSYSESDPESELVPLIALR